MVIYFVDGACFESDQLSFDPQWTSENKPKVSEISSNLPVLDASAYVSGLVPIPEKTGFILSRLYEDPNVIPVDFKDSAQMSDSLDRIAAFVEANGKGKIPTWDELKIKIAKVGTSCTTTKKPCGLGEGIDLKLEDISDFYNQCLKQKLPLSEGEEGILNHLVKNGFLSVDKNNTYHATSSKAVIAMSRSFNLQDRREIFVHEYSHARYFTDSQFRKAVSAVWKALSPEEKAFLRGALIASGYYSSGETWLMETETQAHSVFSPYDDDGLGYTVIRGANNCGANDFLGQLNQESPGCSKFWGYTGDIRMLLEKLHYKYEKLSECYVPLLAYHYSTDGIPVAGNPLSDCFKEKDGKGTLQPPKGSVKFQDFSQIDVHELMIESGIVGEIARGLRVQRLIGGADADKTLGILQNIFDLHHKKDK